MTLIQEQIRQNLVDVKSDPQFLSQKRNGCGAVSNENKYENASKFFIDALLEFLQADLIAKNGDQ